MTEDNGIEAVKPPLREVELNELEGTYNYNLSPAISRLEFEQHPKYAKLVQLSISLFGGKAGFVLQRALTADGKGQDFIGFAAPKGATREKVSAMFEALRTIGIADFKLTSESYPPYPRKPLIQEEISALKMLAAPKREGSSIVPNCEINPDNSLKRVGYKLVDATGEEYAYQAVPTGQFFQEKAIQYAAHKVGYLKRVLESVEDRALNDEFEVETNSFVPREVRFYKDMLAECLAEK